MRYFRIDYGGEEITRWFTKAGKLVNSAQTPLDGSANPDGSEEGIERAKEFKVASRPYALSLSRLPFAKLAGF